MDQCILRLEHRGLDASTAQKLVDAGYYTPRMIKAASDRELKAIPGIGDAAVARIREAIG